MKELFMKLELFHFATNIPLRLYNQENLRISENILTSQIMPAFLTFSEYEKILLNIAEDTVYFTNNLNEHYYSMGFLFNGTKYKLIAGPTIDSSFDKKLLMMISSEKKLQQASFGVMESYFRSLPRYTSANLRSTEPLLRYLLCGSEPDLSKMMQREKTPDEFKEEKAQVTETQKYHHSMNRDALIMEALKNGDRDKLFTLLYTPGDGPEGILCRDNPLRSYKNLFIVTVSYTTKAAIEGGVDSESAYTLSDTFIQKVEEIDSYEEITELIISMINSFLDLVEKAKKQKYSAQIYHTIDYINKHYHEDIRLCRLAERAHISESHLQKIFKLQTGMSVTSFIISKRITEACSLLKYTDHSIADICDLTGFCDQSYMTNQFRKKLKTTPGKCRESMR